MHSEHKLAVNKNEPIASMLKPPPMYVVLRSGMHLCNDGDMPRELSEQLQVLLSAHQIRFAASKEGKLVANVARECYWSTDQRVPNAGLVMCIGLWAESRRIRIRFVAKPPIAEAQLDRRSVLDALDHRLADFILRHDLGTLIAPGEVLRFELLARLLRLAPNQTFVILGRSAEAVLSSSDRLWKHGVPHSVHIPERPLRLIADEPSPRVTLTTFPGAAELDFATSDFVFLLDADDVVRADAQRALEQVDARFRLYGLAEPREKLPPRLASWRMADFGPHQLEINGSAKIGGDVEPAVPEID